MKTLFVLGVGFLISGFMPCALFVKMETEMYLKKIKSGESTKLAPGEERYFYMPAIISIILGLFFIAIGCAKLSGSI